MTRKVIEEVDDLDLYMKVYPQAKRRLEVAQQQLALVEAEMERREALRYGLHKANASSSWLTAFRKRWGNTNGRAPTAIGQRVGANHTGRALAMAQMAVNGSATDPNGAPAIGDQLQAVTPDSGGKNPPERANGDD